MEVRFYRDPDTGEPHVYNHGVSESEAEFVLRRPDEDFPARDGARQALGQTLSGRYLRVIYVPDADRNGIFVVTAFELRGGPLTAFRRRRRKRKGR